jgi:hypothetical protein
MGNWKPNDTYQQELQPGKAYLATIEKVEGGSGWFDFTFRIEGGAKHRERIFLTERSIPIAKRKISAYYWACGADMDADIDFHSAKAHDQPLAGRKLQIALRYEKKKDGTVSDFLSIYMVENAEAELVIKKVTRDEGPTKGDGDDIPF